MDTIQITPQRPPPGVGVGVENKDSKYNNNTYYVPLSADKNFEKSPYHRAALGEHPKSALLSGAQRVIVKNTKSPTSDSAHHTPTQRGTNNFMRPTESSRISSTPVRAVGRLAPSPNRNAHHHIPMTPCGDSANILHFISPPSSQQQVSPNPLMTPTRSKQSTGRVGSVGSGSASSAGAIRAAHVNQVTPSADDAFSRQHQQHNVYAGYGATKRLALASPPGRVPPHRASVASSGACSTSGSAQNTVQQLSPKRSSSTGRGGYLSYLQPTASSQMLFSPDYHSVMEQSPQTGKVKHTVGETGQVVGASPVPVRSTSAPKTRPRSLSSQMQAHSDNLKAVALQVNAVPSSKAVSPVTERSRPNTATATAVATADALTPQQTTPAVIAVANVPSTSVPKLNSPTQSIVPSAAISGPGSGLHARSKMPNYPQAVKSVRSADALSANKAAKLATLAVHTHSTVHHNAPTGNSTSGLARYAQPTHSSSAAATAAHISTKQKSTTAIISQSKAAHKAVVPSSLGIAARHMPSAGESAGETPTTTPQRANKLHKRPPAASQSTSKKNSADKIPANRPALQSVERGTRTLMSAPNKSKLPIKTLNNIGSVTGSSKSSYVVPRATIKSPASTKGNHDYVPADSAVHSDSIMQILDEPPSFGRKQNYGRSDVNTSPGDGNASIAEVLSRPDEMRKSHSFACELSCVEAADEQLSLAAGSIDFSDYNGFDDISNWSARATPVTMSTSFKCGPESESQEKELNRSIHESFQEQSQISVATAETVESSGQCNKTEVGEESSVPVPRLTVPSLSHRNKQCNNIASKHRTNVVCAPLQLQDLETRLSNISNVEAPNSFSPSNISNLSTFSQGTFQDSFTPMLDCKQQSEMSSLHHVPSDIYSQDQGRQQEQNCSSGSGGLCNENAWAKEYTDFFPGEINLVDANSTNISGCNVSTRDVSLPVSNIVSALNYTGADFSNSSDDCSLLQLPLEEDSVNSPLKMATIAASPVPQDSHSQHHLSHLHHHSQQQPRKHENITRGCGDIGQSTTSTAASMSDPLNQAMMMSASTSYSISSMPTCGASNLSLAHPSKIYRQFSENSQSCNVSAITPGEGLTLTSSIDVAAGNNTSGSYHNNSSGASDSRIHVGSSASSMVSNVLDKAMIASYSFDQDIVNDMTALAISESTTSVSPFLRPHNMTRSDSGSMLPTIDNIRVQTFFSPPPPPEAHAAPLDAPMDSTLTASQQFDSSIDAVFNEHFTAEGDCTEHHSSNNAGWCVGKSTETLPPPPPPPIEQLFVEETLPSAGSSAARALSASEQIRKQLLEKSSSQFNRLRQQPNSPSAVSVISVTSPHAYSDNVQFLEPQSSPTAGDLPTIPSFGSIQSLSLLCSTDSAELALSAALTSRQNYETRNDNIEEVEEMERGGMEKEDNTQYEDDFVNMVDDFAENQAEDIVNMGDEEEEAVEEYGAEYEEEYGEEYEEEYDCEVEGRHELSEDEDAVSDYDADPVDLPHVNASIQSMNTSRIGSGGGSANASCSYSYTSSMDELHSVNPRVKNEVWVLDNYNSMVDSLRSSSTLPTVTTMRSAAAHAPAIVAQVQAYAAAEYDSAVFTSSMSSTATAAQPPLLMVMDSSGVAAGVASGMVSGTNNHMITRSTQRVPRFVVREECYRSSRHANSSQPSSLTCPDPLAGQLLLMSSGMLNMQAKKSFRAMQNVFVPLDCGKDESDDEYFM